MTDHICDHAKECQATLWECPHKIPHKPLTYYGPWKDCTTSAECMIGGYAVVRCVPVEGK